MFWSANSDFNLQWGAEPPPTETVTEGTDSSDWEDQVTTMHFPEGDLRTVYRASTRNHPGYVVEHLIKEPDDLKKLLHWPYRPYSFDADNYFNSVSEIGDRGVVLFGIDHAMYGLERLIGSENFALWSIDCRDQLLEIIALYAERIREHVRNAIAAGIRGIFGWVGPELCIPPLMSLKDFVELTFNFDKPLIDDIHDAGGRVWVHCHGRMKPVLAHFRDMGVDVLNPIEPPPMGDITLEEAFAVVQNDMALEGNVETHDLMTAEPAKLREQLRQNLETGMGRRFILCPTSGYMEDPQPSDRHIANLLLYVNEATAMADKLAKY